VVAFGGGAGDDEGVAAWILLLFINVMQASWICFDY
jgi:hypothetical protein